MRKKWILAVVLTLGIGLVAQAPIVFVTNGTGDPPGVWFSVTGA
jgi:hypothetical protein